MDTTIQELINGNLKWIIVHSDGRMVADTDAPKALLPGSFNPLHEVHTLLAIDASRTLKVPVAYELSVVNVDKPTLDLVEIKRRVEQFQNVGTLVLTCAETFQKKANLFPGCGFAVGWDTVTRLIDSKYYGNSEQKMLQALTEMKNSGCRFAVSGRTDNTGIFRTLADIDIPKGFQELFEYLPDSESWPVISSTEIRLTGKFS